jgi:hypothetical protein
MPAMITLAKYLAKASSAAIQRYRETGILPSFVIKPNKSPRAKLKRTGNPPKSAKKKPKEKPKNKIFGMGDKYKQTPKKKPKELLKKNPRNY